MKIVLSKADEEDVETQNFVKFKSNKRKLTGKQSVTQLVSRRENYADPDAKFENADLNELSRMGFLDELITGIKTGKEALALDQPCRGRRGKFGETHQRLPNTTCIATHSLRAVASRPSGNSGLV